MVSPVTRAHAHIVFFFCFFNKIIMRAIVTCPILSSLALSWMKIDQSKRKEKEEKNNDEELFLKYFAVLSCIHLCHSIWLINSIVITALLPGSGHQSARKWRAVGPVTGHVELSVPTYFFHSTHRPIVSSSGGEMYTQRSSGRILFSVFFFTFLSKCWPKESSLMCIWFCLINFNLMAAKALSDHYSIAYITYFSLKEMSKIDCYFHVGV